MPFPAPAQHPASLTPGGSRGWGVAAPPPQQRWVSAPRGARATAPGSHAKPSSSTQPRGDRAAAELHPRKPRRGAGGGLGGTSSWAGQGACGRHARGAGGPGAAGRARLGPGQAGATAAEPRIPLPLRKTACGPRTQSLGQCSPSAPRLLGSEEPNSKRGNSSSPLQPTSTQGLWLGEAALGYRDIGKTNQDDPSPLGELQARVLCPMAPGTHGELGAAPAPQSRRNQTRGQHGQKRSPKSFQQLQRPSRGAQTHPVYFADKTLWRTRDHETFSNRGVLCKYDIIYCSVSENYSGIGTSVQPTVREMRVTYVQRFQDTEKLCKEEVVSGTFWSLFIETFCPTVNPPILGRPIYLPRGPCKALATPPSRLREQQRGRRSAALVTRRVWLRGAVLLGKREKAPYPLGKQKMAPTPPVSEAGGPAAQFLLSRVSVPRDGEAASPRLPQRLPSARSPQAQVSPAERCQRGSPAPVGPRRWAERREQLGSDAISGGSAGLATKETQGQLLSEGKQGGPSLGDRRPSGGRAQKQLCPKTGLAAGARGAGTKQHRRGSTYTGVSSPVPR